MTKVIYGWTLQHKVIPKGEGQKTKVFLPTS